MPFELRDCLLPSHRRVWRFLWRWFRHSFQLASATGSVNWGLIFASSGWILCSESTKEGAEDSSKPMAAWTPFFCPPCAYCSETLTYSSGGISREGLDLGGSFGRFQVARRFGRKLQTPFIGFGKGQGQLLSSRPRVLFKKPSPRYRVACAADTDSDVHCGSYVHLLRFVPAHCTGEHFAILGRHGVFGR